MQVTVDYREEQPVFGNKAKLYVNVGVQFSEEEKAIIRSRSLEDYFLPFDAGVAPQTAVGFMGAGVGIGVAPILIVGGFIYGVFGGGNIAGLIIIAGIAAWFLGKRSDRRGARAVRDQTVTLGSLLRKPNFTIFAANHADAQRIEEDIRAKLTVAKNFIMSNAAPATSHRYQI